MAKGETAKKFATIAAICNAFFVIGSLSYLFFSFNNNSLTSTDLINLIIGWMIGTAFALSLFMRKKKVVAMVAGAFTVYRIYYLINFVDAYNFIGVIACATLFVIMLLGLKNNMLLKKVWFIAGALFLVAAIAGWIKYDYFRYINQVWHYMLLEFIKIAGFTFIGLWAKEDMVLQNNEACVNEYSTFDSQKTNVAPASHLTIGGADKLKMYKELLDSGILTQDEFNAMKKQILDL